MAKITGSSRDFSQNPIMAKVREFVSFKNRIDDLTKSQNVIKAELMEFVDSNGIEDDKGHLWYELPEEVDGVVSLQRQRRVSQKLDMDAAEILLKKKGLYDRCVKMVPILEEDEVMACLYSDLLTEDEVDEMFPKTITWAFVPSKK
jgi:hypothetical protein